ncbi:hypothetical protein crov100 [Cafeteria roenbergensis virus]|uniref:Uncharacterized protein n=1 Tax=Cafeteria roenbergensis virus (strain BV-PW1) TaxID=693272 RepID=E3T4M0_CROVB|nr:hypothetical protein crov100 [Cafeteria roenbergensis virus BV-PW1]ADO67133.1 hypothetical protein crov100 [Cafeteria roenbergensis virus BV-PW1]
MSKYRVCKRTYLNHLIPHEPPMKCNSPDCWGAHAFNEFVINDEIKEFRETNLTSDLIFELFLKIKTELMENWEVLTKLNIVSISKNTLTKLDFLELLNIWKKSTCACRKYYKNFSNYSFLKSKNISKDDIPTLNLDKYEPLAWGFIKSFASCPKHLNFLQKFKEGSNKITLFKEFCTHSHNCKEGTHHLEHQICYPDMKTGICSCPSKNTIIIKQKQIDTDLELLKLKLTKIIKYRTPIIENAKGELLNVLLEIRHKIYEKELNIRKIHLSDNNNYIPFDINFNKYITKIKKETLKESQTLKLEQLTKLVKTPKTEIINETDTFDKNITIKKIPNIRVGFRSRS